MIARSLIACCALMLGLLAGAGCNRETSNNDTTQPSGATTQSSAAGRDVVAIPKGTTHEFWKTVEAGANRGAAETGLKLTWKGPVREDDRAQQIQLVEQFVSDGVAGICLAPLDSKALVRPVKQAAARNIPVVIFDSPLEAEVGTDFVTLVATDNRQAGNLGGQELSRIVNKKGSIVLLRYVEGSASTDARESGFLDAVKANPDMKLLVSNRYGGATTDSAQTEAMNMLDTLKAADGIFCPNESSTLGMLGALRKNNLAGKVKFVGFDATPSLVEALEKGEIDALVAQNPEKMGYEAIKALNDKLAGKTVPKFIDTGVVVITRDNINSPDVKALLKRP